MAAAIFAHPETTTDAFLGGRFVAVQPADGRHRAGLEALLLAAAVERSFAGAVVDLGAGAGVAGLAVAARCPGARVVLVERDPIAIACARATLALPVNRRLADRVTIVAADISASETERAAAGLARASAEAVIVNPPFHAPGFGTASPNADRAEAHVLAGGGLDPWLRTAASLLESRGRLFAVFRADGLEALLAACHGRFGAIDVLPIHPRVHQPARRVLIGAVKGSRAGLRLLPGFVLHPPDSSGYTPEAEAVMRDGADLVAAGRARRGE